jgi:tetratricopeptide (TPR) repeat protein
MQGVMIDGTGVHSWVFIPGERAAPAGGRRYSPDARNPIDRSEGCDPVRDGPDEPTEPENPTAGHGGLVGRQREMTDLLGGLADAMGGRGRLFLLSGEPGIGKSRLADELGDAAHERGATVLWGRCWEAGGAPAYWPWVQSLRGYVRDLDETTLRRQLGSGAAGVAQVVPELGQMFPELAATPLADPEAARFQLFDAVTGFLVRAGHDRPIVLIVDDLQAADVPSLLLLQFLAGELHTTALLVVGTYRDIEIDRDHPLTSTLAELVRYPGTRRLHLHGLEPPEVARYVEAVTGRRPSMGVVAAIHRETDGNPFFLGEVARLAAAEGRLDEADPAYWERAIPQGVREVIGLRVNRLSKECSRALSLASVLGREFGVEPLEQISALSREELEEVMDEAAAARVVGEAPGSPGRLRFAHALIRDTLYDELPPSHRIRLHARAGYALEALYGADLEPHLAELAHHFSHAGRGTEADRAINYASRAGDQALIQLAYEEAIRLYRMALHAVTLPESVDESTRVDLLLSLGDAGMRAGDAQSGRESFLAAAGVARRLGAREHLARAALGYGGRFVWARAANDPHLVPLLRDALRSLGQQTTPLRARLMARLSGALRDDAARESRATLSAQAVEMARRLGDPATLAYALDGRYAAIWAPDTAGERLAIADEIIALADEIGDAERAFQGHHYRLSVLMETGDLPAINRELETNARAAEALHQPAQRWYIAATIALLALFEGRLAAAEGLIAQAYDHGRHAEGVHALGVARMQEYALRREQGRPAEMEKALIDLESDYSSFWPWVRAVTTHMHAELGRTSVVKRLFEECAVDGFQSWPLDNDWLLGLTLFADVCTFLGDGHHAAELYALLSPYESRNGYGHPEFSTGCVARSLGNLASTMGRFDDAERHYETALERNTRMGAVPWVAHTHHDLAMMLLTREAPGDRERATEELHEAAEIARRLGQVALEGKVVMVLAKLGVDREIAVDPVPRPVDAGPAIPNVFRREGEYWLVAFDGHEFRLQDTKGLTYLAALLANPGREIHALDLVTSPRAGARAAGRITSELGPSSGRDNLGAVLDDQARAAYRGRIEELQATIDEAEGWNDSERAAQAHDELDFLVRELAAATGLGGRDRRVGSDAERARVNVTRAIRSSIARIQDHDPEMGRHLERTVRTGTFCVYESDPRATVDWAL